MAHILDGDVRESLQYLRTAVTQAAAIIDALLRALLPQGPCWYRYNGDGYGEHEDGSPFPGETHPVMVTLRAGRPCSNVVMGVTLSRPEKQMWPDGGDGAHARRRPGYHLHFQPGRLPGRL